MSVCGNSEIRAELNKKIFLEPFREDCLNPSSYNLRVSDKYFVRKIYKDPFTLQSPDGVHRYVTPPKLMSNSTESLTELYSPGTVHKLEDGETRFVVVPAHGSIIFATMEIAGCLEGYSCEIKPRSSLNRLGLNMNVGWGDPGFVSHWGVTLTNPTNQTVCIPVGSSVCQLVFYKTSASSSYSGSYQVEGRAVGPVEHAQATWKPEHILPKPLRVLE